MEPDPRENFAVADLGAVISRRLRERQAAGMRVVRPPEIPADLRERILREEARGVSLCAIAARLNRDGAPAVAALDGPRRAASRKA
jgi:hypothetical protein